MTNLSIKGSRTGFTSEQQKELEQLRSYANALRDLAKRLGDEFPHRAGKAFIKTKIELDATIEKIVDLEIQKIKSETGE